MSGGKVSPDGKWAWDGSEWIPNTQATEIQMSDSVISGDIISNQNVNSVDSEVVKAAMTGVVEAIKELQPITRAVEPKSNSESTRLKELEMETYLLEEKKRLKGIDRKRAYYRKKSRRQKRMQILILVGLTMVTCYYIITNNISF